MKTLSVVIPLLFLPLTAHAYVGPGAGLGAIAVTIAFMLGLLLLVVGFVWYPLKRLLSKRNSKQEGEPSSDT